MAGRMPLQWACWTRKPIISPNLAGLSKISWSALTCQHDSAPINLPLTSFVRELSKIAADTVFLQQRAGVHALQEQICL